MRMVEASSADMRRRRKRKRSGCGGCMTRLAAFTAITILICIFGYKLYVTSGLEKWIMQTRYPLRYQEFVEEYSNEFGIEDNLVYSIIYTESKFDPYAVSQTDARGVMQIQDETARDCVKTLGIKNYSADLLFVPEINIRIGCFYLKKLIKMYDGNLKLAVAAYNGGPGNVDKWLKNNELSNEKGELIHIPFMETRSYVEKIFKIQQVYDELYN